MTPQLREGPPNNAVNALPRTLGRPGLTGRACVLAVPRESHNFQDGWASVLFLLKGRIRLHVHVQGGRAEGKFWLEPEIELAQNYGLSRRSLATALRLIREHEDEIRAAWKTHFRR